MNIWYLIITAVLIIAIIVAVTFLAFYYKTYNECTTYANIWCWDDWTCPYSRQCQPGETDYKVCWPGVTALYNPIIGKCSYPADGGLPPDCNCSFQGTNATCLTPT